MPPSSAGGYKIIQADAREWLKQVRPASIHAVITDPPYGVREFRKDQLEKMRAGRGGVWRISMKIGGHERKLLPRFTEMSPEERQEVRSFFAEVGPLLERALVPGGHVLVASQPVVMHHVMSPFEGAGLEPRGAILRVMRTLRGGFRPKGAEEEFPEISSLPRACWEPWLLFRKTLEGTLSHNLRKYGVGGLRRLSAREPMLDLISSSRATAAEEELAPHPTLKPQSWLRLMVRSLLPMGRGTILDPFMGSGSTIAACLASGVYAVGVEADPAFFNMAKTAIPKLARIQVDSRANWEATKRAINGQATLD